MLNEKNSLAVVSISELNKIIEESVEEVLQKSLPKIIKRANLPTYLDTENLCKLANFSPSKCQYLRDKNKIPFLQQGRTVLYPTEEILAYLEQHRIEPNQSVIDELSKNESI